MTEFDPTSIPLGYTRDANGRELTYRSSTGFWWEYTRDANGRVLTYRNSAGFWSEYTYDANGLIATSRAIGKNAPVTQMVESSLIATARA